jgi:urease accessory protein
LSVEVDLGRAARATVTTPACERIYRSIDGEAFIHQRLHVGRNSRLDWVPQETIVFDRARLRRRFDVRLECDAEITLAEAVLFGRAAMGESVKKGFFREFWTVHRGERLVFADAMRIAEPFDRTLACSTTLRGCVAMACLVHVGEDLEVKRDALRTRFADRDGSTGGASVIDGVLVARIVASSGSALRSALIPALVSLRERPLPRNWFC